MFWLWGSNGLIQDMSDGGALLEEIGEESRFTEGRTSLCFDLGFWILVVLRYDRICSVTWKYQRFGVSRTVLWVTREFHGTTSPMVVAKCDVCFLRGCSRG